MPKFVTKTPQQLNQKKIKIITPLNINRKSPMTHVHKHIQNRILNGQIDHKFNTAQGFFKAKRGSGLDPIDYRADELAQEK